MSIVAAAAAMNGSRKLQSAKTHLLQAWQQLAETALIKFPHLIKGMCAWMGLSGWSFGSAFSRFPEWLWLWLWLMRLLMLVLVWVVKALLLSAAMRLQTLSCRACRHLTSISPLT